MQNLRAQKREKERVEQEGLQLKRLEDKANEVPI